MWWCRWEHDKSEYKFKQRFSAHPDRGLAASCRFRSPQPDISSMLNGVRSGAGAGALTYDSRLGVAANRHANDMAANNFFSHTGSDGSTVGQRVTDAGYQWNRVGENIARGQVDEQAVLDAWMNSSGHRANNLDPRFEDFALAKADSARGPYWVLVLARER